MQKIIRYILIYFFLSISILLNAQIISDSTIVSIKEKNTPDTCKYSYLVKIIEKKINEYFNRDVMNEFADKNELLFFTYYNAKNIHKISFLTEQPKAYESEINKFVEFLNGQKELFPNCCCYTIFEEGINVKFDDTIKHYITIPTFETRNKYKKDRPKVKFNSNKYTSVGDSCYDYYSEQIEKLLKKKFKNDIVLKLIQNKKYIHVAFYVWPNDSFNIRFIRSNDIFFSDEKTNLFKRYLEKKIVFKYCFFEQGEFEGEFPYGSPILYDIFIPNPIILKRYKAKGLIK